MDAGVVLFMLNVILVILIIPDAGMLSYGSSAVQEYQFRNGGGYPLFSERDKERSRKTGFPPDLWPDLAIAGGFFHRW